MIFEIEVVVFSIDGDEVLSSFSKSI